jgi:hypothetical protein
MVERIAAPGGDATAGAAGIGGRGGGGAGGVAAAAPGLAGAAGLEAGLAAGFFLDAIAAIIVQMLAAVVPG